MKRYEFWMCFCKKIWWLKIEENSLKNEIRSEKLTNSSNRVRPRVYIGSLMLQFLLTTVLNFWPWQLLDYVVDTLRNNPDFFQIF